MCFGEKTGDLLWQLVVPKREEDPYHDWPKSGISSPVTVEGDRQDVSGREEMRGVMGPTGECICVPASTPPATVPEEQESETTPSITPPADTPDTLEDDVPSTLPDEQPDLDNEPATPDQPPTELEPHSPEP